jgi:integrase
MSQGGHIRKRGQSWTAYYFVSDASAERRQRSKGGFRTKSEAQAYLTSTLAGLHAGTYTEPSRLTVGAYLTDRWLPAIRASIRPSTWSNYRRNIDNHIVPELGEVLLQKLTADQLDRFYADKLAGGRTDGRNGGLAPKTVRGLHTLLHKALRDAERKHLVSRNVADAADPPRLRQAGSVEMRTWTAAELRSFIDGVADHRLAAAWFLAATTGMRRGEVLGLRWQDVDLEHGRLAVRQTVLSIAYELVMGTPKTARGRRSIALDQRTVGALRSHRQRQDAEKVTIGAGYRDADFVFARPDGAPTHPDYFSQAFDRIVTRLGLPKIRLHDLRHSHATLGLAAGVPPKVMSDRLGHSTVSFTQDVYMHAIPSLEVDAAVKIADLIFGEHSDESSQ